MRYNIESVIKFVEENSNCKLLTNKYKNNITYMDFICECGNEFKTTFKQFKNGKRQCNKCSRKNANKDRTYTIEQVKEYCDNIGIILLTTEYVNCKTQLELQCKCGNIFNTTFDAIKNSKKHLCDECTGKGYFKKGQDAHNIKNHNEFVKELELKVPEFELLDEYIDAKTKIRFRHKNCGHICYKTPDNILNKFRGCPKCNESKGERKIRYFLESNDICFETQKTFYDCRNIKPLPFDFYIPILNTCIEYDGEQHFKEVKVFTKQNLEQIKLHDSIKTIYCKQNNIRLIRINYKNFNDIEKILYDKLIPSEAE